MKMVDYSWIKNLEGRLPVHLPVPPQVPGGAPHGRVQYSSDLRLFMLSVGASLLGFFIGLVIGLAVDLLILITRLFVQPATAFNYRILPAIASAVGALATYWLPLQDAPDGTADGAYAGLTIVWFGLLILTAIFGLT